MTVFMPVDNARIMDFHARKVGFIAIAKTNRKISAVVLEQQMMGPSSNWTENRGKAR
jgi:hypothetical protein